MLVRIFVPVLAVLALVGVLVAIKVSQIGLLIDTGKAAKEAGPPPETVGSAESKQETWRTTLTAVGSVEAERGVVISNDSPGIVTRVNFDSGDEVKSGHVLVELETSVERAQLASSEAQLELAQTTLKRTQALQANRVVSEAELDAAKASMKRLEAEVSALRAQIERKIVRAPFSGKLGIREVNLGQYLAPGSQITTLQSEKQGYVDFTLPQDDLDKVRVGQPVELVVKQADIKLSGVVAAIAPSVDPRTRSVSVRASTQDPEKRLRPGMFINVTVALDDERQVVTVPVTAVVYATYGDSIFLIETDPKDASKKIARQQFVKLGETRGDFVEVEKGLAGGKPIVTAGSFKLNNGSPIQINNDVPVEPKLHPEPDNR